MDQLTIYTLGAAKENPGPAVIGVIVVNEKGEEVLSLAESIGNATNDYAEYFAAVRAFQALKDLLGDKTKTTQFELKSQSSLVINHLSAKAEIKDVSLIGHFIEIYNLRVASFPELKITLVADRNKEVEELVVKKLRI